MNAKKKERLLRTVERQKNGLRKADYCFAAAMIENNEKPSSNPNSDPDVVRERRAWVVLTTLNRISGNAWNNFCKESLELCS